MAKEKRRMQRMEAALADIRKQRQDGDPYSAEHERELLAIPLSDSESDSEDDGKFTRDPWHQPPSRPSCDMLELRVV